MCIKHTQQRISWRKDDVDEQMYNCVGYFCTYLYGLSLNGWHALLCIANNHHGVTITTHATRRHFLIWMTTVRQPTKRRRSSVLTLKYTFICVYWWTRHRIHNTLIVVDRYLRLMGDMWSEQWVLCVVHKSKHAITGLHCNDQFLSEILYILISRSGIVQILCVLVGMITITQYEFELWGNLILILFKSCFIYLLLIRAVTFCQYGTKLLPKLILDA